jgi:hypothetical protein
MRQSLVSLPGWAIVLSVPMVANRSAADVPEQKNQLPADVANILDKAKELELYSLDPDPKKEQAADGFHGWKVLGKTIVKDAETRKKLLAVLKKGIADNKGEGAKCFEPRHGIRATYDGKSADLVICFACDRIRVFVNEKQVESWIYTTNSPQPSFDKVLTENKVPLPGK